MTHAEIALGLGIARQTLETHFAAELSIGAQAARVEVMQGLFMAAKKGSVAAARVYTELSIQVAPPPAELDAPEKPEKPKGKKEQAVEDAKTAQVGTEWAELLTPPPSRLQ